jgi:hypothetical protein
MDGIQSLGLIQAIPWILEFLNKWIEDLQSFYVFTVLVTFLMRTRLVCFSVFLTKLGEHLLKN